MSDTLATVRARAHDFRAQSQALSATATRASVQRNLQQASTELGDATRFLIGQRTDDLEIANALIALAHTRIEVARIWLHTSDADSSSMLPP